MAINSQAQVQEFQKREVKHALSKWKSPAQKSALCIIGIRSACLRYGEIWPHPDYNKPSYELPRILVAHWKDMDSISGFEQVRDLVTLRNPKSILNMTLPC